MLAPRLPAMWGRATFAMLVSSTSMMREGNRDGDDPRVALVARFPLPS